MINGARLRQVREAREMSQKMLAEKAGIPQPFVSQIETDARLADGTMHRRLADALGVPSAFLTRTPILLPEGSLGTFRSVSSKTPATAYHAARRKAEMGIEAIGRLAEDRKLPKARIETVEGATSEEAAIHARAMLRLPPDAPIGHLTRSLERAGVLVLRLGRLHEEIHGFSAWTPEPLNRPMIAARTDAGPFRLRFTLAHELGHLVMGHQVFGRPGRDFEKEAHRFAAHFLLPEEAMRDVFEAPIDLRRLAEIKGVWGVSMHAILLRAKAMGYVDEGRYRSLREVMRRKGWLEREPGDERTQSERPRLFEDLAQAAGLRADPSELVFRYDFAFSDASDFFGDGEYRMPVGL